MELGSVVIVKNNEGTWFACRVDKNPIEAKRDDSKPQGIGTNELFALLHLHDVEKTWDYRYTDNLF